MPLRPMTVHDLLRHTSGLQYHPGTTWEYSVSTDVLGRVIEVVTGMPLDRFLAERVTKPLKMRVNGFPIAAIDTRWENGGGFGLGFAVRVSHGRSAIAGSVGDFGSVGIWGTQFWVDPKEQMCVVMMLQTGSDPTRARYWTLLRNLAYQAIAD
jgi:CubicO group peptidase (beta-lactamase class C family)